MKTFLSVDHLSHRYPAEKGGRISPVLQDISFEIHEGEFTAIIGQNGCGKTTLARHLNGMLIPTAGRVLVDGLDTRQQANLSSIRQQVGMVFQHPEDQIVSTVVEDDVAFGPENLGLPTWRVRERVDEALKAVDLWEFRLRPPHMLSAGQKQRLALAGVLAMRPRCVVFDEATTMLDPAGRHMVLEQIRNLHGEGMTIIFITHSMAEAAFAGRVLVLEDGKVVMDGTPRQVFANPEVLAAYRLEIPPAMALARRLRKYQPGIPVDVLTTDELQRAIFARSPKPRTPGVGQPSIDQTPPADQGKSTMVHVENLGHVYMAGTPFAQQALEGVNLQAATGMTHGLAGRTGSGKSTLLQHLNGLLRPQTGRVQVGPYLLNDANINTRTVIQLAGLVFQNPEMQFFEQYVGDEIAYGPRQLKIQESLSERVRWAMEIVGLDFVAFKDRLTYTLSGGEKRKVALASVLALRPELLLLDEPTAGLDPLSRRELLERLKGFQTDGTTLVVSSHQMDDLVSLAEDVSIFQAGHVAISGHVTEVFGRSSDLQAAGLEAPLAAQAAGWLREKGVPISDGIVTVEQLEKALVQSGNREVDIEGLEFR